MIFQIVLVRGNQIKGDVGPQGALLEERMGSLPCEVCRLHSGHVQTKALLINSDRKAHTASVAFRVMDEHPTCCLFPLTIPSTCFPPCIKQSQIYRVGEWEGDGLLVK